MDPTQDRLEVLVRRSKELIVAGWAMLTWWMNVITILSGAQAAVRAIRTGQIMEVKPLQDYHRPALGN